MANKGGAALYGKGPKIEPASAKHGDVNKSGHEAKAAAEADVEPKAEATMNEGGDTKADVMAGTGDIPVEHQQHMMERADAHVRHMGEHKDMHHRQERDYLMRVVGAHHEDHAAMSARHHADRRAMHTRHEGEMKAMAARHGGEGPSIGVEKDEGKAGTNKE